MAESAHNQMQCIEFLLVELAQAAANRGLDIKKIHTTLLLATQALQVTTLEDQCHNDRFDEILILLEKVKKTVPEAVKACSRGFLAFTEATQKHNVNAMVEALELFNPAQNQTHSAHRGG